MQISIIDLYSNQQLVIYRMNIVQDVLFPANLSVILCNKPQKDSPSSNPAFHDGVILFQDIPGRKKKLNIPTVKTFFSRFVYICQHISLHGKNIV